MPTRLGSLCVIDYGILNDDGVVVHDDHGNLAVQNQRGRALANRTVTGSGRDRGRVGGVGRAASDR